MKALTFIKLTFVAAWLWLGVSTESHAQLFGRRRTPDPTPPREVQPPALQGATPVPGKPAANGAQAPTNDSMVFPSNSVLPEPLKPEEMGRATIPLPNEPIEPYLLTKDAGPFMVLAHTFRGPDADRYALALVLELRRDYRLPAYILRTRDMPGRSLIRNVPPTAPEAMKSSALSEPERSRTQDEAAVLVGNEKTLEASRKLLSQVQKIHPKCLDGIPNIWSFRKGKGLRNAIRTQNPFVPAEQLFPRQPDALVQQINGGPNSIFHCPAPYVMQVAEFSGRTTFDVQTDRRFQGLMSLKSSPLASAHVDAEKLAAALSRDKDVIATGYRPYVYHDRVSSKVYLGGFNSPDDPGAAKLRQRLIEIASDLNNRKTTEVLIVPALSLTSVDRLKAGDTMDMSVIKTSR